MWARTRCSSASPLLLLARRRTMLRSWDPLAAVVLAPMGHHANASAFGMHSALFARYLTTTTSPPTKDPPKSAPKPLPPVDESATPAEPTVVKPSIWERVKAEGRHYWAGSKLLAANVSTASKLLRKLTNGKNLTRRERRLLTITAADLARLVPFLFFVLIPFMELLLPVALYVFPNMLPSTFQDKHKKEEGMKKQLKLRLDLAEFLQETTEVMAKDIAARSDGSSETGAKAKRLVRLLGRVRLGKFITNDDLIELTSLFKNELTLEHLSRQQLLSISRYMGLPAYGRDSKIRYELIKRLDEIRDDDRTIVDEGLDYLDLVELRTACAHRGMRVLGVDEETLKNNLRGWLHLSLDQSIPPVLLVLSRVLTLNLFEPNRDNMKAIQTTLANLGSEVVDEMISEATGPEDNAQKLEQVKRQLELLKEEEAEAVESQRVQKENAKLLEATSAAANVEELLDKAEQIIASKKENLPDDSEMPITAASLADLKSRINEIGEVLVVMTDQSAVAQEREKLDELTEKWKHIESENVAYEIRMADSPAKQDQQEDLESAPIAVESSKSKDVLEDHDAASKAQTGDLVHDRLQKKIGSMLQQLRSEIDQADSKIGDKLRLLDKDHDGVMSYDEVVDALRHSLKIQSDEEARAIVRQLDIKQDGKIDTEELREIIRQSEKKMINGGNDGDR